MITVAAFNRKLSSLDIEKQAETSIDETKEFVEDLNVQQLTKGLRSDGTFLPDYSPVSVNVYGKKPGPIRLFDTGDFYRGINARVQKGVIVIDSSDSKSDMLEERYVKGSAAADGGDIFGLTTESRIEYIKDLEPVLIGNVKKTLKI